jgi:hypothetical protein
MCREISRRKSPTAPRKSCHAAFLAMRVHLVPKLCLGTHPGAPGLRFEFVESVQKAPVRMHRAHQLENREKLRTFV